MDKMKMEGLVGFGMSSLTVVSILRKLHSG